MHYAVCGVQDAVREGRAPLNTPYRSLNFEAWPPGIGARRDLDLDHVVDARWTGLGLAVSSVTEHAADVADVLALDGVDSASMETGYRFAELLHRLGAGLRTLDSPQPLSALSAAVVCSPR